MVSSGGTSIYDTGATAKAALPEGAPSLPSRISWGAIFDVAVVAVTIGIMLNAIGAGLGSTTVDAAARDTPSASSFGIGAAIWLLVSNLIGLAVGGYVAARLSGTADHTDGTLHGLAVWGTTFLLSAVLLGNLVAGIASTATSGISSLRAVLPKVQGPPPQLWASRLPTARTPARYSLQHRAWWIVCRAHWLVGVAIRSA